ncbi:hypothetical protein V1264_017422 [Littorina saxatilis]|uniref:Fibronectin type-III domain-containing protein n=1 Tax=Littorina saxatilis TaxID=31220 RepID=A0AAN9GGQ0_9CAEN
MMDERSRIFRYVCLLTLFLNTVSSYKCANIDFPTTNEHVSVTEFSNLKIPFNIRNYCVDTNIGEYTITVKHGSNPAICNLTNSQYGCTPEGEQWCKCPKNEGGLYYLVKTVSRTEGGEWTWCVRTAQDIPDSASINVIVTYPPSVSRLFLNQDGLHLQTLAHNSSVDIVCQIEKGNPDITTPVRLLRNNGTEIKSLEQLDDLHFKNVIQHVQCEDMGYVSCDMHKSGARDVSVEKTLLLVECPPKIIRFSTKAKTSSLCFFFRSHTPTITKVKLDTYEAPDDNAEGEKGIRRTLVIQTPSPEMVSGSPPDLKIEVDVTDLLNEGLSHWQLELSNKVGSDSFSFYLEPNRTVTGQETPLTKSILSISISCGAVLIVVFIFVIIRRRRRILHVYQNSAIIATHHLGRPLQHQPLANQGERVAMQELEEAQSRRSNGSHSSSNNTYEEVDDISADAEEDPSQNTSGNKPESSTGDSYLHPVSSTADLTASPKPTSVDEIENACSPPTESCVKLASAGFEVNVKSKGMPTLTTGVDESVMQVDEHDGDDEALSKLVGSGECGEDISEQLYENTAL